MADLSYRRDMTRDLTPDEVDSNFEELEDRIADKLDVGVRVPKALSGGGGFFAMESYNIQDSGNYFLPEASLVPYMQWVEISLPMTHASETPLILCSGNDIISVDGDDDTSILMNMGKVTIKLYSDGVSVWKL